MKKKVLVIMVASLFLVAGALFAFLKIQNGSINLVSPDATGQTASDGTSLGERDRADNYVVWNDPAGFAFSYPESWLFDPHNQDVTNYANIDITKLGIAGGIKILVSDSKYKTIIDWADKDNQVVGASLVDTTLGGVIAKKALLSTGDIVVGMIDSGALYTLKLTGNDNNYWKEEYGKLLTSFKLVYPTGFQPASTSNSAGTSSGGDIIEEEEEIIE